MENQFLFLHFEGGFGVGSQTSCKVAPVEETNEMF